MRAVTWNYALATLFIAAGVVGFFLDKSGWWLFVIFAALALS